MSATMYGTFGSLRIVYHHRLKQLGLSRGTPRLPPMDAGLLRCLFGQCTSSHSSTTHTGAVHITPLPPFLPLTTITFLSFIQSLLNIYYPSTSSVSSTSTLSPSPAIPAQVPSTPSSPISSPASKVSPPRTTTYYYYPKSNMLDQHGPAYQYITVTRTPSPNLPPLTNASTRTNTPSPRTPTSPMAPMARTASNSPRVSFDQTVRAIRPPRDDELSVMRVYARHASHCAICAEPYLVWENDDELCDRGHAYARDVAKYIYSKGGRPHSVIDKKRNDRYEIEVPVDCEVIRKLTKAFHKGLNLRNKKPTISRDSNYAVSDRRPLESKTDRGRSDRDERRYYDDQRGYGVEITPGGRRERERYPREQREGRDHSRKRSYVYDDSRRGSLYQVDAADKASRRYQNEPVILLAEPRKRYAR